MQWAIVAGRWNRTQDVSQPEQGRYLKAPGGGRPKVASTTPAIGRVLNGFDASVVVSLSVFFLGVVSHVPHLLRLAALIGRGVGRPSCHQISRING